MIKKFKHKLYKSIRNWSLKCVACSKELRSFIDKIEKVVPDLSDQESHSAYQTDSEFFQYKRRLMHAFQSKLMLKLFDLMELKKKYLVVDIGDSAGSHMLYLKYLVNEKYGDEIEVSTTSVNLDPVAIEKIKRKGLDAVLCRAENLDINKEVDFYTSFEMVEHLHNPSIFFYRLAKKGSGDKILVTVPYVKRSRVALHNIRNKNKKEISAEQEHIFELSPEDWELIFLHSGWKIIYDEIHYQYPRRIPIISQIFSYFWRRSDYEGFWGVILEKDTTYSDLYMDWEEI